VYIYTYIHMYMYVNACIYIYVHTYILAGRREGMWNILTISHTLCIIFRNNIHKFMTISKREVVHRVANTQSMQEPARALAFSGAPL